MKKILLITVGFIAIAGAIAFYTYNSASKESVAIEETTSENDGGKILEIKETDAKPIVEEFPMDMSEEAIKNAIHSMSHQKIKAKDKWGFVPMTAERIARLIMIVENNKYNEATLYLSILNRWKNNDFSQVDKDHNAIWRLQNGNVGKASGILTVEEEQAFIEEHFKVAE